MINTSLFIQGDIIAVALSGGKDSMCLLHLLQGRQAELGITVKAINVEHGIRGAESVADSQFVVSHCQSLGVPVKTYKVDSIAYAKESKKTLEQAARELRYKCFYSAINEGFCNKIAVAHHLSDSVETVLFNMFRGCSTAGIAGIRQTSEDGLILRPMLTTPKEIIDEYIEANNIPYCTDSTNFDEEITRNYIRNRIIPTIKQRFPDFENSVMRLAEIARDENEYMDSVAKTLLTDDGVKINNSDATIFCRACLIKLKQLGFAVDYTKVHLDALAALRFAETGARIDLKNSIVAYKSYDRIVFEKQVKHEKETLNIEFSNGTIETDRYILKFEKVESCNFNDGNLYFDGDKLPYRSIIRIKQTGDKITAFGGINKTLKKYLTDKKIEARVSAHIPLVCFGDEVFIVCGVGISQKVKVDGNTKNIIKAMCIAKQ